jgi:hypothetical protein
MVVATRILRKKKEYIPFSVIASFFSVSTSSYKRATRFPKISAIEPADSIALGMAHGRNTKKYCRQLSTIGSCRAMGRYQELPGRIVHKKLTCMRKEQMQWGMTFRRTMNSMRWSRPSIKGEKVTGTGQNHCINKNSANNLCGASEVWYRPRLHIVGYLNACAP